MEINTVGVHRKSVRTVAVVRQLWRFLLLPLCQHWSSFIPSALLREPLCSSELQISARLIASPPVSWRCFLWVSPAPFAVTGHPFWVSCHSLITRFQGTCPQTWAGVTSAKSSLNWMRQSTTGRPVRSRRPCFQLGLALGLISMAKPCHSSWGPHSSIKNSYDYTCNSQIVLFLMVVFVRFGQYWWLINKGYMLGCWKSTVSIAAYVCQWQKPNLGTFFLLKIVLWLDGCLNPPKKNQTK